MWHVQVLHKSLHFAVVVVGEDHAIADEVVAVFEGLGRVCAGLGLYFPARVHDKALQILRVVLALGVNFAIDELFDLGQFLVFSVFGTEPFDVHV